MTRVYSLAAFAEHAADGEAGSVVLRVDGAMPPKVTENLRRLHRLDLLNDETVWALVGQPVIDPLGLYGALKNRGAWAFSPLDFSVVQVLATQGTMPVAVMQLDLLSNEVVFIALKGGHLVVHSYITPDELEAKLREPGVSGAEILAWIGGRIAETVAAGMAAVQ